MRAEVEDLRDEFDKVRALILCAYANDQNEWGNNALNGKIAETTLPIRVKGLFKLFKSVSIWSLLLEPIHKIDGSNK